MEIFSSVLGYKTVKPMMVFDKHEIQLILKFCEEMHLEYGELDIIRNSDDNKIYIIDVNTTAHKPKSTFSQRQRTLKNKIIRQMFSEQVSSLNGKKTKSHKDKGKLGLL